jgi:hypothetical protein
VSGLLLIGFGLAYAIWGLRHVVADRLHGHHHDHYDHVHDPSTASIRSLVAIYCADPCVAVIPILFAAAQVGVPGTLAIVLAYEVATIATMVALVTAARVGAGRLRDRWIQRWGDPVAGCSIVLTGITVAVLGW